MGVNRIAGTFGCTMEPPAATEYAVLPVGVASITPSACTWTYATQLETHQWPTFCWRMRTADTTCRRR